MLSPTWNCGQTPHQVSGPTTRRKAEDTLFNLSGILKGEGLPEGMDSVTCGTTRMIRIYQQTGAKFSLLQRIDWETQLPDLFRNSKGESVWIGNTSHLDGSDLDAFIDRHREILAGVVIKDLNKGVISETLIQWLVARLPHLPWFVSTKAWWPKWFDDLKKADVRLLMIPQVAAHIAVRSGDLNCWITRSGNASEGALYRMDQLATRKFSDKTIIVALPDGLSILARDRSRQDEIRHGLLQTEVGPEDLVAGMPMASVLFPALVSHLLRDRRAPLEALLRRSLRFTHKWMAIEVKRVEDPEEWEPSSEQILNLDDDYDSGKLFEGNWTKFDWTDAREEWEEAASEFGILKAKEPNGRGLTAGTAPFSGLRAPSERRRRLELWRAMLEVDGYICCAENKRRTLQNIVNEIGSFEVHGKKDHRSYMLIASPGSGKTYLVRCIAKSLNLSFLGFNITQMISKSDLLDCFDTIVTYQAQNRDRSLLVFVDEINAKLDGQRVYDTFLAPLEEHVYIRAGKTFHIDPCVWVFAGTEHPVAQDEPNRDKSDKASDFESRLTAEPFDLTRADSRDEECRLEKVYLGVSLLRSIFPDVRKISEKVLRAFHSLPPTLEAREVKHFVESFIDIQYGEVKAKNVDNERLKRHLPDIENWKSLDEGALVEIRS
jgi:hypothetical protein